MGNVEGTIVIRAWVESADNARIRARLISSQAGCDEETVELAADAAAVLQAVQRWLNSLQQTKPAGSI